MPKTDYSACYNLPATVRGDTLDGFKVTLETVDKIESAEVTLCRKATGDKIEVESTVEGNAVFVHDIDTSALYAGLYSYTIKFTVGGRERTYLTGNFDIIERCRIC